jgi:hypothetical protein
MKKSLELLINSYKFTKLEMRVLKILFFEYMKPFEHNIGKR